MQNVTLMDVVRIHIKNDQPQCDAFYAYILDDPEGRGLLGLSVRGCGSSGRGNLIDFYEIEARPLLEKFFTEYAKGVRGV